MSVRQVLDEMDYGSASENDHEARLWLDSYRRRFGHMIGGQWIYDSSIFHECFCCTSAHVAAGTGLPISISLLICIVTTLVITESWDT